MSKFTLSGATSVWSFRWGVDKVNHFAFLIRFEELFANQFTRRLDDKINFFVDSRAYIPFTCRYFLRLSVNVSTRPRRRMGLQVILSQLLRYGFGTCTAKIRHVIIVHDLTNGTPFGRCYIWYFKNLDRTRHGGFLAERIRRNLGPSSARRTNRTTLTVRARHDCFFSSRRLSLLCVYRWLAYCLSDHHIVMLSA
jgi:hypothetical protein